MRKENFQPAPLANSENKKYNMVTERKCSPAPFVLGQGEQIGAGPGWSPVMTGPWILIMSISRCCYPQSYCNHYHPHNRPPIKTDLCMLVFCVFSTMSLMPCTWFALEAPPFLATKIVQFHMSIWKFYKMWTYSTLVFWTGMLDESSSSSESE